MLEWIYSFDWDEGGGLAPAYARRTSYARIWSAARAGLPPAPSPLAIASRPSTSMVGSPPQASRTALAMPFGRPEGLPLCPGMKPRPVTPPSFVVSPLLLTSSMRSSIAAEAVVTTVRREDARAGEHRLACDRSMRSGARADGRSRRTGAARRAGDAPGCGQHPGGGRRGRHGVATSSATSRRNQSHFYPERTEASSSSKAEGMSREECLS